MSTMMATRTKITLHIQTAACTSSLAPRQAVAPSHLVRNRVVPHFSPGTRSLPAVSKSSEVSDPVMLEEFL